MIVGDGELRDELKDSPAARSLGERLHWAGFRRDIPDVCVASDVVVLTSDNEGTPVSLIEAQASAVPVVSTQVGGVAFVVRDGETGLLAAADDHRGLAQAVAEVLDDPVLARRLAAAGRDHARRIFTIDRLVDDVDALYRDLLEARSARLFPPRGGGRTTPTRARAPRELNHQSQETLENLSETARARRYGGTRGAGRPSHVTCPVADPPARGF